MASGAGFLGKTLGFEPLTAQAFAPYGAVIEPQGPAVPANGGTALRYDLGIPFVNPRKEAELVVSVFDCRVPADSAVRELEKHPYSAQLICPLEPGAYAVIVSLDNGRGQPDPGALKAFYAMSGLGVVYPAGMWHHGIWPLERQGRFLVQSWQDGSPDDCVVAAISGVLLEQAIEPGEIRR